MILANKINSKEGTTRSVAKLYNISQSCAGKYSKNVRIGKPPSLSAGRPPKLDKISRDILNNFSANNKSINFGQELKDLIKNEFINTQRRCHTGNYHDFTPLEVPFRTYSRYFKVYNTAQVRSCASQQI
jgi:hypothetical protein